MERAGVGGGGKRHQLKEEGIGEGRGKGGIEKRKIRPLEQSGRR